MIKKLPLCLAALAVMTMAGCRKDPVGIDRTEPGNEPETVSIEDYPEKILGQWNATLDKCYELYTEDDGYEEGQYANEWASSLSLTFKSDGKVAYLATVGGVEDGWDDTYSVEADTLIWDKFHYKISKMTSKELVIHYQITEQHTTSGGGIRETSVTKHWELTR